MPSVALKRWRTVGASALDEIESAHKAVGGLGPGRRHATREINHAYAVMLASHFQRFCRDLHSEAVPPLVGVVAPPLAGDMLRTRLLLGRKLDAGNASPSNLGSDFGRFGFPFWNAMKAVDRRNGSRQIRLEQLNEWRNAIAHHDFTRPGRSPLEPSPPLHVRHVRSWRSACNALARSMDAVVSAQIGAVIGTPPW